MSISGEHYLKQELYALLQESSAVFDFLQVGSLDGIWYWDLENPEHEWMSPRFWEVFGYAPEDHRHMAAEWQDMIFAEDLKVVVDNFERHCNDPNHPYDQVVRYAHRDGSTVWVRCRGMAIRDRDGKPIRLLGAHTELTRLKLTEEELRLRTKRLEETNAELTQARADLEAFSHLLAHDLKAPLITVSNYSSILLRDIGGSLDEEHRRYLDRIVSNAKGMKGIIDGLRDITFLASESSPQELDLTSLAKELIEELRQLEPDRSVEFEVDQGLITKGDPDHLRLLLMNLLGNAWKFTAGRDPARIHFGAEGGRRQDDRLVYYVRDNGVGFDDALSEKLFVPLQRLHSRQGFEGTGLGLTTVRRAVSRYGGEVWAEGAEGKGATFRFTLGP